MSERVTYEGADSSDLCFLCVCVCVCVCEKGGAERERESESVCVCLYACFPNHTALPGFTRVRIHACTSKSCVHHERHLHTLACKYP